MLSIGLQGRHHKSFSKWQLPNFGAFFFTFTMPNIKWLSPHNIHGFDIGGDGGMTDETGSEPEVLVRLGSQTPFVAICRKVSYAIPNELG